jgi:beta-lactamase regulating signal transducer with metallopeptidase domain/uncharacterized GH25 family protein
MTWHVPVFHWLANAALGGFLLLGAGCLAVRCCRQPVRRLRLIELTLLGCLLVPWLSRVPGLPHWSAGLLGAPPADDPPALSVTSGSPAAAGQELAVFRGPPPAGREAARTLAGPSERPTAGAAAPASPDDVAPATSPAPALDLARLAVLAYAGVAAVFVIWSLVGLAQLAWLQWNAYPAPGEARRLFRAMAGPAGDGVRLLASDRIELPVTFRGWRPVILLPGGLCRSGDAAALRFCLAHEWCHVQRRDVRTWNLATLAQLLFFYQPLFWWLRRQLRLCQDYLADARAAQEAPLAEDYASYLVGLARRRLGVAAPAALGISDRRSNLYRRVIMLVHNREPLERRCPGPWNRAITAAAVGLLAVVSALRVDAGDKPQPQDKAKPAAKPDKKAAKGQTFTYSGKVTEAGTGKPLAGATVTVRRSLYGDPKYRGTTKIVQETKHVTDAKGQYHFTIPPEQAAETYLYIELDVSHPTHAPRSNFGYSFAMIRKNEKMGGRPFFERVELSPGEPLTGTVQGPDGKPAAGVKVLAYSKADVSDFREYGSFANGKTDARGHFKIIVTKGKNSGAVFWLLPTQYAPSTHLVKKRGDQGLMALREGVRIKGKALDAKGKPLPGIYVNADREREQVNDEILQRVASSIRRGALTNAKGEFELMPLPPGKYNLKADEYNQEPTNDGRQPRRPLPAVFLPQPVTLKEGQKTETVELRATPHVVIEARYLDSKGKPSRGHECFIFGQVGNNKFWFGTGRPDAHGKIVALAPHGLAQTRVDLMTNEHGVLRHRVGPGGKLKNQRQVELGTLTDDVKGIEIIRYVAPILLVRVKAKDGGKLQDAAVTADYPPGKAQYQGKLILKKGLNSDVSFEEQEDGRFRSSQLFPDQEVTVTGHAKGYAPVSLKVKPLKEGVTEKVTIVLERKQGSGGKKGG